MRDLVAELKQLRLHGMVEAWTDLAGQGQNAGLDTSRWLLEHLLQAEHTDRAMRSIRHQMHTARFPLHRDLAGFDFSASTVDRKLIEQLADLTFTEAAHNVVFVGGPGTGKTHLATALGIAGITHHSQRVRFYSTVDLVNALEAEKAQGKAGRLAASLQRLDLVILDELGYLPFSQAGGALLFHLLSKLYEHTSVMITTNLDFAEWSSVFVDAKMFNEMLKLVHAIDRVLRALTSLAGKLMRHEEDTSRRATAQLDTRYELDQARRARAAAREHVTQWEAGHPWLLLAARTLKGGEPPERLALTKEVERQDRHVQTLKQTLQTHRASLDDLGEQETSLKVLRTRSKDQLKRAMGAFVELGPTWVPTLVSVVPEGEQAWIEGALPENGKDALLNTQALELPPEKMTMRLRPAPRP